jgi:alkylation response protein AidB-like acyl-CoA dehydrogenase
MSMVPKRVDELEDLLGPLTDGANPCGASAILAADERGEMLADGEAMLGEYGLNAEFVPAEHGGRLTRADHLVEVMRTVYRRDPALGLGYGASSLIAGVLLWTAANHQQATRAARILLDGGRIAVCFHELAHGNDIAGTELAAARQGAHWVLRGRKEVVTNIQRADARVVLARTDQRPGPRSHSLMFLDGAADGLVDLPRFRTTGMRGVQLGGLVFDDVEVPSSAVVGSVGSGLETALKAFQVTRTLLPAMGTATLDTALRIAVDHLSARHLYGGAAIDLPFVRSVLVGVFADLLRAEAFSAVCVRALHVAPGSASAYAAAVKFAVSKVVIDALNRLSELLGAHFYLREGPCALFQKLLRDTAPIGFGHIARAACQTSLLPQLPLLARRSWQRPGDVPVELFDVHGELAPLRFDRLSLHASGRDPVAASLAPMLDEAWEHDELRATAVAAHAELGALAETCAALQPSDLGVDAASEHYDLVTGYVRQLERISCLQVWRHAEGGFLAEPAWARAALHRLAPPGSGFPRSRPIPDDVADVLFAELLERHRTGCSFGLAGRFLPLEFPHSTKGSAR